MRTRVVVGIRPPEAPEGWEIYNAPRPLCGHTDGWIADFICGVYFNAVNPNGFRPEFCRQENEELHATLLTFVTEEQAFELGMAELNRQKLQYNIPDGEFEMIVKQMGREGVVDAYLQAVNG